MAIPQRHTTMALCRCGHDEAISHEYSYVFSFGCQRRRKDYSTGMNKLLFISLDT